MLPRTYTYWVQREDEPHWFYEPNGTFRSVAPPLTFRQALRMAHRIPGRVLIERVYRRNKQGFRKVKSWML